MAAFMRNVRFYIPTEAAGSLLRLVMNQLCAGCPISVGGEPPDPVLTLQLFQNDAEITDATVFADLFPGAVVAPIEMNTEAAPGYCDTHIEGPSIDTDGLWKLIFDQATFETTGAESFFGAFLYADFGDGDVLVAAGRFDEVVIALNAGDFVKVTGTLPLPPVVPEVIL